MRSALHQISNAWKNALRAFPIIGTFAGVLLLSTGNANGQGADAAAAKLRSAGFEQKLGTQLPLDAQFVDESGRPVKLGDFFRDKPVVLTLNYFACPMLCTLVLNGYVDGAKDLPFKMGREYETVTISFDPRDNPEIASGKKANYVKALGQPSATNGWHFLTGTKEQIDRVCEAAGFSYVFDEKSGQYGHASGIMVATPAGKLSHYLYGIEFKGNNLRLALVESSQNRIGSPVDKLLLWCLHYDPVAGKYTAAVMSIIRGLCILTVLALAAFLFFALRQETGRTTRVRTA